MYNSLMQNVDVTALCFGPIYGCQGDKIFVSAKCAHAFRGEKLIAEDSAGARTRVRQLYVDGHKALPQLSYWQRYLRAWAFRHKLPRPLAGILRGHPGANMPTSAFSPAALGNGLSLPVCQPEKEITIEVEFLTNGTWWGQLFGNLQREGEGAHS